MSGAKLEINFRTALEQAARLEETADTMKSMAHQQIQEAIQNMSSSWKGETAAAYFGKVEEVRQEILSTADCLYEIADNIRTQARRVYESEKQAIELTQ